MIDRALGIGGSDAAVIVLGSQYGRTRSDLVLEKTGLAEGFEGNRDTLRGETLEDVAIARLEETTGGKVVDRQLELVDGVLYGHIDGILELDGERYLVEIKCPRMRGVWKCRDLETVPEHYLVQMHHYYAIGPQVAGWVCGVWSCDDWDLDVYEGEFDEAYAEKNAAMCIEFWDRCVVGNEDPGELSVNSGRLDVGTKVLPMPPHIEPLARDLKMHQELLKTSKSDVETVKAKLIELWPKDCKRLTSDFGSLSISQTKSGVSVTPRWKVEK